MRICPQCSTETNDLTCPDDGYQTVDQARFASAGRDPLIGTVFQGRYRLEKRLGAGGMGTVYLGTQLTVDRPVAVKILHASLADNIKQVARFQREARAIAGLKHPNTIRLIDFGHADNGSLFIITELLDGEPVSELILREAPLPAARVIRIGRQVLEVLAEAHGQGIIHRDLKPENIFVNETVGRSDYVKVFDFGIAKIADEQAGLTGTGVAIGSPRYMAPEQARGGEITAATDIYALGVMMYELLTGHMPFDAGSPLEYLVAHVNEVPRWPEVDEPAAASLIDVIMSCLAKQPADRPASAAEALARLDSCQSGRTVPTGTSRRPSTVPGRPAASVAPAAVETDTFNIEAAGVGRARRGRMWVAAAAVCLIGGGVAAFTATAEPDPAPEGPIAELPVPDPVGTSIPEPPEDPQPRGAQPEPPADVLPEHPPEAPVAEAPFAEAPVAAPAPVDPPAPPPAASVASFTATVKATPRDAAILVDGKRAGAGTATISWSASEKPPRVSVRRRGFKAQGFRLKPRDATRTRHVRLAPDYQLDLE